MQLSDITSKAKIVVMVGLPGTGKSLLVNHLFQFKKKTKQKPQLIQWDVARKEYENGELKEAFPFITGQTHPGVRLSAGYWLMSFVKKWHAKYSKGNENILLIEAPFVGNRFSELCHQQSDQELEKILSSEDVQFVLAVPSDEVRKKIEEDRAAQISEDAKQWSGAKPSVMYQLWKDTMNIAREFGITDSLNDEYNAALYSETYSRILQHRKTKILSIDKILDVQIGEESILHSLQNEMPNNDEVKASIAGIKAHYPTDNEMFSAVSNWYQT